MLTLTHDPTRSARPNTYAVEGLRGGLVEILAYVRVNDAAPIHEVRMTIQTDGAPRRKDREGMPTLLATRVEGTTYAVESAVVHHELARETFVLLGLEVTP